VVKKMVVVVAQEPRFDIIVDKCILTSFTDPSNDFTHLDTSSSTAIKWIVTHA
jgi:hypothetical protein